MSASTPRFVLQHHTGFGPEHWDLMLEVEETLMTWQLHRHPATVAEGAVAATRIGNHRRVYLTYEGPVSGNRGSVRIVDSGSYRLMSRDAGCLHLEFSGRLLKGRFALQRLSVDENAWLFQKHEDEQPLCVPSVT